MKILDNVNIALFQAIEDKLNRMITIGSLDMQVLGDLKVIATDFETITTFWEDLQGDDIENRFILYHYSKNAAAIVENVIEQFQMAKIRNQNPEMAQNILDILPSLSNAYEELLDINATMLQSEELFTKFSERTRVLREIASTEGLLPSMESCLQKVDAVAFEAGMRDFSDEVYSELHIELEEDENQEFSKDF